MSEYVRPISWDAVTPEDSTPAARYLVLHADGSSELREVRPLPRG